MPGFQAANELTVVFDGFEEDDGEAASFLEPIFHRKLEVIYSVASVQLLQRSIDPCATDTKPRLSLENLRTVKISEIAQAGDEAVGNWRNYIVLGCKPTWPFNIVTVYRGAPSDSQPTQPYSRAVGSVVLWTFDATNNLVRPVAPKNTVRRNNLDLALYPGSVITIDTAFDIGKNQLAQVITFHKYNSSSDIFSAEAHIEFVYGKSGAVVIENEAEEPFSCMCGLACTLLAEKVIKTVVSDGIYCFYPFADWSKVKLPVYWSRIDSRPNVLYFKVILCSRKALLKFFPDEFSTQDNEPNIESSQIYLHSPPRVFSALDFDTHSRHHRATRFSHVFIERSSLYKFVITYDIDTRYLHNIKVLSAKRTIATEMLKESAGARHKCKDIIESDQVRMFTRFYYNETSAKSISMEELQISLQGW